MPALESKIVHNAAGPVSVAGVEREGAGPVAVAPRVQGDAFGLGVRIVRVGGGLLAVVGFADDPGARVVLDAVLDAQDVAGEPAVHELEGRGTAVAALVIVDLDGDAARLQSLGDAVAVLGHHVPVVEGVGHEGGRADAADVVEVVAAGPKVVVVAGGAVEFGVHLVAHVGNAVVAHLGVAAEDEVEEDVDVLAGVAAGGADEAVRAVVVVVRRVGGDGDDRFEALDTGGGGGQREGAVVGGAGHADLAVGPVGLDLFCAVDGGEPAGASVQPVDDGLGRERLVGPADGGAPLRLAGAGRLRVDDREAARDPGADVRLRDDRLGRDVADVGREGVAGRGIIADLLPQVPEVVPVGACDAGVIGAGLVDDGDPEPLAVGLGLARDVDVDAVGPAVAVGVEFGLDPQVVADPGGGVGEGGDDPGLAVLDDGAGLGGGRACERGQGEEGEEGGGGCGGARAVRAGAVVCAGAGEDHRDFGPGGLSGVGIGHAGAGSMRGTAAVLGAKATGPSRSAHVPVTDTARRSLRLRRRSRPGC